MHVVEYVSMSSSVLPRFDKSIGNTVLCDASMEYVQAFLKFTEETDLRA